MEQPQSKIESGWRTETEKHGENIQKFLQNHFAVSHEQHPSPHYDSLTELHISGMNSHVMQKIAEGTATIVRVNVHYENGEPDQIHVVFDSENKGHYIDVYLRKRALTDYLESESR